MSKKNHSKKNPSWIRYVIALALICVIGGSVFTLTGSRTSTANAADSSLLQGKHYVQFDIADYGTIIAELDADIAPVTVSNFVKLVNDGFYDGLTFHRIISGFMIQGGDPNGNGTGGSSERIRGEFAANGVQNDLKHTRGVLSMARSSHPDSASSQFFIMHKDAPHLDGQYAAFGVVLSGMDVVDAICDAVQVEDRNGTVLKDNQPVISQIRMITAAEAGK